MKRGKWQGLLAITMLSGLMLSACGANGNAGSAASPSDKGQASAAPKSEPVTISVMTNIVGVQAKVLQDIADQFMKDNPDIKVDFSAPGADYENIMKLKMASNELPDVFSTHGWAKARYGNYLADLRGESWASQIDDAIKPAVTDDKGKVYVLPMDQDKAGPAYNVDVLKQYGVSVPQTWEQFLAACETIKTKSGGKVAPIHIGAADSWPIGQFLDYLATPVFISPKTNFKSQFLDGSFDWSKFDPLPQMLLDLQKKGYLNKDVLTAKYEDSAKALADGTAAFGFYGPSIASEAKKINPNVHIGLMPIPSVAAGDTPTFAGGEKTTWGVWKDSKHIDAAKKFVAYYAKPENVSKVAAAQGLPPGLKGVDINAGDMTQYFKQYANTPVFPYFDRVYLPNGLFDVMSKNAQDLLANGVTVPGFSANMKKEYDRLRAAQ